MHSLDSLVLDDRAVLIVKLLGIGQRLRKQSARRCDLRHLAVPFFQKKSQGHYHAEAVGPRDNRHNSILVTECS